MWIASIINQFKSQVTLLAFKKILYFNSFFKRNHYKTIKKNFFLFCLQTWTEEIVKITKTMSFTLPIQIFGN